MSLAERIRDRIPRPAAGFNRRLLLPMVVGAILNPVNSSIIAVSLIPIGAAFGAAPSDTAWLVSGLYLATAVGQPLTGKLIDLHGPRRLFLVGTCLVGLAGVLGALAPNLATLVLARVVLGLGTCAGYPAAMSLIRSESDRTGNDNAGGVLTLIAISGQTIAVIGPPLGGLLIGLGGWRTTLAINIPLALVAFVLGYRRLPRTPRRPGRAELDLLGMALFTAALVALLLFLLHPQRSRLFLIGISVVVAAGFVLRELRTEHPFLDLRLLGSNRPLLATYARALLAYVLSYAFLYGFTQWLEDGRHLSAAHAGLVQIPLFVTGILISGLTGRNTRFRAKLIVGSSIQLVCCGLLLVLNSTSSDWLLVGFMLLLGIPQGLNSLALQNAVYRQANSETIGAAAGLLRTFTYLGAIIASAVQGFYYAHAADTPSMHTMAALLVGIAAVLLLFTVADRSLRAARAGESSA